MSKLNVDQIAYLRDVLGVESLIVPYMEAGTAPALDNGAFEASFEENQPGISEYRTSGDQNAAKLIVLIASQDAGFPLEGEAGDLTHKMIQAMKYPSSHVFILEWNHARPGSAPDGVRDLLAIDPKPLLIFGPTTASSLLGEIPAFGLWTACDT
jgi:hypothetical protein